MAIVYQHRRLDTNEVFYIGIGKNRKRAYDRDNHRNSHWKGIVEKYGYEVDILIDGCTWEEACEVEKGMIQDYGRHDLGEGTLANQTNGGDGGFGMIVSEEAREKIRQFQLSLNKKGKPGRVQSDKIKEKIKNTLTGRNHSEETRQKMRKPKSEEHAKKLREVQLKKAAEVYTCPHCSKTGKGISMKSHHFDNCLVITGKKKHEGKKYGKQETYKCPHCDKEGGRAMFRYHFDKCLVVTGEKGYKKAAHAKLVTCPHCNKEGKSSGGMKMFHFDNCKFKK